ncbi:arylamine N-acetyltransferase/N-hydroxyarylamine O-acetyltransferase [Pseudonocardia ammonioxydans]|uniref:Arylamine N-acetyltransferase/N-hydroxyarylamine O-acetyltransferase n=1 Tax=Pseudonocardia ammonioxydans TaxID=260086 RepID=A0A1I5AKM2_PSUAM|nr:arylamine N-acetyltransferase [Pseudonocardia ammonioxydans]SFN62759.1 arylamine N-acetyltransferase/N-hydroxyarylamine O-acetyltransferase [Pseudonocardia ammonioxydans]
MTTTTATPTVASYLDRIGAADAQVGPDLLARIVRGHNATIPFENLDPFTGTEPPVDGGAVAAKLVHGRRGGWCFEHNRLLHDVLDELGYRVTPLVGRVRLGLDASAAATSRTHRLTLVETDEGVFTADVGFGATTPTEPLRLEAGTVQRTAQAEYRYRRGPGDTWVLERRGSGDWADQYVFDLTPTPAIDYAMGSWYLTHHPDSGFRRGLAVALSGPDRRSTLSGNRLTVRGPGTVAEEHELGSPAEVLQALDEVFGIDTAGVAGLAERVRRVHFTGA